MASHQKIAVRPDYHDNTEDGLTRDSSLQSMRNSAHVHSQQTSTPFTAPSLPRLIEEVNEWIKGNPRERPPGTILFHKIDIERFPPVEVLMLDTRQLASVRRCQVNARYMIRVLTMPNQYYMFVRLCGNGHGRGARRFQAWHGRTGFTDNIVACEKRLLLSASEQPTPCSSVKRKRAISAPENNDTSGSSLTDIDPLNDDAGGEEKNETLDGDYEEDTGSSHSTSLASSDSDDLFISENEEEEREDRYAAPTYPRGRRATRIRNGRARKRRRMNSSRSLTVNRDGSRRHVLRDAEETHPLVLLRSSAPEADRPRGSNNVQQANSEYGPSTQRTGRPQLRIYHQQDIETYLHTLPPTYTIQETNASAVKPTRPILFPFAPISSIPRSFSTAGGSTNPIFTPGPPATTLPPPNSYPGAGSNPHRTPIPIKRLSSSQSKRALSPGFEEIPSGHWTPNPLHRHTAFPTTPISSPSTSQDSITFHFHTTRTNTTIPRLIWSCSTMLSFFDEVLLAWTTSFPQSEIGEASIGGGGQARLKGVLVTFEGGKRDVYVPWKSADAWEAMMRGVGRGRAVDVEVRCVGDGV